MLQRSTNVIFSIFAAVLVLMMGTAVFPQSTTDGGGKGSGANDVGSGGKIGISDVGPMSPYARPNIGTGIGDSGFARQRPPSMVDIPSTTRRAPSSTSRPTSLEPPGPIPNIVPPPEPKKGPTKLPRVTNYPPGPIPNIVPPPEPKKAPKAPAKIGYNVTDPPPYSPGSVTTNEPPGPIPNIVPPPEQKKAQPRETTNYPPGPIPNIVPPPEPKKAPEPIKRPIEPPGPIPNIVPPYSAPVLIVTDKYAPKS